MVCNKRRKRVAADERHVPRYHEHRVSRTAETAKAYTNGAPRTVLRLLHNNRCGFGAYRSNTLCVMANNYGHLIRLYNVDRQ
jgi:hypothetical protein